MRRTLDDTCLRPLGNDGVPRWKRSPIKNLVGFVGSPLKIVLYGWKIIRRGYLISDRGFLRVRVDELRRLGALRQRPSG